ncbi:hypothetical protein F5B22DRAFT_582188 [Xylaria bambusicola]|uniref:uncharacterized protein n=1 Tax=Xylaria bambusicola TaxID=326684 RepID=UPI002007F000|nr:uncharacterized protein F5B22DRAFT_582188 [Xylaria bambusicola]KAI0527753.1 hypothetical protein F5B22DRAFT_582188 [Xylaria bambusicola]
MWSAMKRIFNYLANLEWTERVQHACTFCDRSKLTKIVYEDDDILAIENRRLAGESHWLIMPKTHGIRDIEALNGEHLDTLQAMDRVKNHLIAQHCTDVPSSAIISGYHRGRRPLLGNIYYPDIISIHHLHLHVIVRPRWILRVFKYPAWLPLMWKSDVAVLKEVRRLV